jgi:putative protease
LVKFLNRAKNDKTKNATSTLTDPTFSIPNAMRHLEQTFSRGLSTGWLEGTRPHTLVSGDVTSHRGTRLGTILEVRRDAVVVKLTDSVHCGDGVFFENTNDPEHSQGGRVYEIIRRRESVKEAEGGAKVLLTFANHSIDDRYVAENQTIWKTDDPRRQREIQKTWKTSQPTRRILLEIKVRAEVGKPIEIVVTNKLGANIPLTGTGNLEPARKHPLTLEMLREQLDRLGGTIYTLGTVEAEIIGNPMIPLSVLGTLRREMIARLDAQPPHKKPYTITDQTLESIRTQVCPFPVAK